LLIVNNNGTINNYKINNILKMHIIKNLTDDDHNNAHVNVTIIGRNNFSSLALTLPMFFNQVNYNYVLLFLIMIPIMIIFVALVTLFSVIKMLRDRRKK